MKTDFNITGGSVQICTQSILRISFVILFLIVSVILYSQENILAEKWGFNTAYTIKPGRWESGIFQPFRIGLNEKLELNSNLIIMPLLPNAGVKFLIGETNGFQIASEHSLSYPSLFLNLVSFKGTGGLISPQYDFPFILSVGNSITLTKPVGLNSLLSADIGFIFAVRQSKPNYNATIDLPLFYPRMAHYYEGTSIRAGITFKGVISQKLFYEENARIYVITRESENFFFENYGTILWNVHGSFRIKGGYVLSWGKYPFGNHTQLWPVIDIVFGSPEK